MESITIKTKKQKEIVDITDEISKIIRKKNLKEGAVILFITHTTAALTTADLDPGMDKDLLEAFWELVPKLGFHQHHDPAHTPSHILSSLIGTSLTLPIENGELILGTWQRVVLIELDGPKERKIVISLK